MGQYFNSDRFYKYGLGVFRLLAAVYLAWRVSPPGSAPAAAAENLIAYWESMRWMGHAYIGVIGATVNVDVLSFKANLALLLLAGAFCVWDVRTHDLSSVIYLMKTFGGDYFAGKLDTTEWRLVLLFVFGLFGPAALCSQGDLQAVSTSYLRILCILFGMQLFCEYGDNHWEQYMFFRHRYSYEVTSLGLALLAPLQAHELAVLQFDMVICLFYRVGNLCIILLVNAYMSRLFVRLVLKLHSLLIGVPVMLVSDPELVSLVLRESNRKGEALEKYSSVPAWRPILSLESEDGPQWRTMSADFHSILHRLPPVSTLSEIAARNVKALKESHGDGSVIEANALVKLTIETYLEYVLRCRWRPAFDVFVAASWEWRKEIAIKGRGDMAVKTEAVRLFVSLLKETDAAHSLWGLFGDRWHEPQYYSLILQPFVISPSINVGKLNVEACVVDVVTAYIVAVIKIYYCSGDVMVSVQLSPAGTSLEAAMRSLHPFPLFERYVDHDLSLDGKTVDIKANTQVEMFLPDLKNSTRWPLFGAGERACAGRHLALPFLKVVHEELTPLAHFDPRCNHLYSGRSNDGNLTVGESIYFVRTIGTIIAQRLYARLTTSKW